jgi:hypothetical protein
VQSDKEVVLQAVKQSPHVFGQLRCFRDDEDVVLQAFQHAPFTGFRRPYYEIDPALTKNPKIKQLLFDNGDLLYFRPLRAQQLDFVMDQVTKNGEALAYAHSSLQNNKTVVMAAVKQNGRALESASYALRRDFDVVLAAVSQNGTAISFALADLKANCELVQAAVLQCPVALLYVDHCTLTKTMAVLCAEKHGAGVMSMLPFKMCTQRVLFAALKKSAQALRDHKHHSSRLRYLSEQKAQIRIAKYFVECWGEDEALVVAEAHNSYSRNLCIRILHQMYLYRQAKLAK